MQKADAVGCAGMLIRRDVLEKMEPPWFFMEYDSRGLLSLGEDFWFCRKMASYGYEVWADCELAQKHMKSVAL